MRQRSINLGGSRIWPDAAAINDERGNAADIVLVSAHLGPNMVQHPGKELQTFKMRLLAAGADIIHGHSAHVFQGVQTIGRRIVLHDAGDFLDAYAVDPIMHNDWSFLFLLDVDTTGVRRVTMRSVKLGLASVNLAVGDEFVSIRDHMLGLSEAFGTELQRCDEGLELCLVDTKLAESPQGTDRPLASENLQSRSSSQASSSRLSRL